MKKKREKRNKRTNIFGIILFLIMGSMLLIATTYCAFLYLSLQTEKMKTEENSKTIIELQKLSDRQNYYTEEEIQAMINEKVSENSTGYLDKIKEYMSSGEGTLSMLQYFYPNEVVVADGGKYYFFPILDQLTKNNYKEDQFTLNNDNEMEYYSEGNKISHKGIDVSKFQEEIDWKKVQADGVEFAFIRLGIRGYQSGKLELDAMFSENISGATEAKIETGVYFFTQAVNTKEAIEEADFVIDNVKEYDLKKPIVYDIEELTSAQARTANLTKQERTDICIAFCERIKEAGYTPMIYGNMKTFLIMLDLEQLENYEKWFAYYKYPLHYPYQFGIWQYSNTGKVDGIEGEVDMNISFE